MTALDPNRVVERIESLPGDLGSRELKEAWDRFSSIDKPVITVFGSYDTGKSSLIRRILVDADMSVPEWLTISGRHETFEVDGTECVGCLIRDTPGLAVGAADVRGVANTDAALAAVELTDIAIVVVAPQLATGERDVLRALVDGTWTSQDLWFVIARFDEAGIDPEEDLDGYRALGERKIDELRESLGLTAEFPVHVVTQDFSQFAGASTSVDAEIWDEFREWDGMEKLERAVEEVGTRTFLRLRAATEQRYWRRAVVRVTSQLRAQLAEIEPLVVEAEAVDARHDQWLRELHGIDLAARADIPALRDKLAEGIMASWQVGTNQGELVSAKMDAVLRAWIDTHQQHLDRFLQSAGRTWERQSGRSSWLNLQEVASLVEGMEPALNSSGAIKHLSVVGGVVLTTLQEFQRSSRRKAPQSKGATRKNKNSDDALGDWTYNDLIAAAAAVAKIAQVALNEWEKYRDSHETAARNQELANARSEKFASDAAAIAVAVWDKMLDEAERRLRVLDVSSPVVTEALRESVGQLRAAIVDADKLLLELAES